MSTQHASRDGVAQLTELMRHERVIEPPSRPADPVTRRRRRRRAGLVSGLVTLAILAGLGGYTAFALTADVGTATFEVDAPAIAIPAAAELRLSADGATAVSVRGGEEYLGAEASGVWATGGEPVKLFV